MTSTQLVVVIADDEPVAREYLGTLLRQLGGVRVVAEAADGDQALAAIRAHRPELIFLDVQMPRRTGLAVVRELAAEELPLVVITTAFPEYALDSFEIAAADFLVKPFDERRLARTLDRARAILDGTRAGQLRERMARAEDLDTLPPGARRGLHGRLPCRVAGRIRFVDVAELESISAADESVFLHLVGGRLLARESISALEARTAAYGFVRIHRSTIVNPAFVKEIESLGGGEYTLTMGSGATLRASASYGAAVRAMTERNPERARGAG